MYYTMPLYLFAFKIHLQASENASARSSNNSAIGCFFSARRSYRYCRRFPFDQDIAEYRSYSRKRKSSVWSSTGQTEERKSKQQESKREKEIAFGNKLNAR
jgi:predicted Fe-S protein YdhL (DUF1289 family)